MRLGQHLAKGVPIEMGGKTHVMGPITLNEFAEFQEYLFRKPLVDAADFCVGRPEVRDVMMREAMRECKEMRAQAGGDNQSFDYLVTAMTDIGNMRELMFICIKKNHPEITKEFVAENLDLLALPDVLLSVMEASGLDGDAVDHPQSPGPTREEGSSGRSGRSLEQELVAG